MSTSRLCIATLAVAAAAGTPLLMTAAPAISAPSTAAPATDSQGYVDSTARCASPDTPVIFGSTKTSRVAICKQSEGGYEYRGVRVGDGARLVLAATRSGDEYFVENSGITYTVTPDALTVSAGDDVIRTESMLDVHVTGTAGAASAESTPAAPKTSTIPTPTTPLPPPLPAEVGGA